MELRNFIEKLPKEIDACIISNPVNIRYFTGFNVDAGYIIISRNGSVFMTDSRYIEAAQAKVDCCDVVLMKEPYIQIVKYLKKFNSATFAIEADHITVSAFKRFTKIAKTEGFRIIFDNKLDKAISALRCIKKKEEIESIKAAQLIAQQAYDHVIRFIKPGMTEKEVALALNFYMLRNGADDISFETIVLSGKKTSLPHGVPDEKEIDRGDFVTMDFGAVVNGYHSDMTRTFAVGTASDMMSDVYSIVLNAQTAAIEAAAANVPASTVDYAARSVIAASGYGNAFGHATGHGVGIEIHEEPRVSETSSYTLRAGNIITVEPGIYLPDQFGVRIEDMLLITPQGNENLTDTPKELLILNNR